MNAEAWDDETRFALVLLVFKKRVMINRSGRGHWYCDGIGEISGSSHDQLLRKQLPSTRPLIKSESRGIEDDQIPS